MRKKSIRRTHKGNMLIDIDNFAHAHLQKKRKIMEMFYLLPLLNFKRSNPVFLKLQFMI